MYATRIDKTAISTMRAAGLSLLFLLFPFVAQASNQDQLLLQDLDAAAGSLSQIVARVDGGGRGADRQIARSLGLLESQLNAAQVRATAVYTTGDDQTIATGLAMLVEWLSKASNAYAGIETGVSLAGDIRPGVYDQNFHEKMDGTAKAIADVKARVRARATRSPSMEYFVRAPSDVREHASLISFVLGLAAKRITDLPRTAVQVCFLSGAVAGYLPAFEGDLGYLEATDKRFAPARELISGLVHGPRFGETFCSQAARPVAGLTLDQSSEQLKAMVSADKDGVARATQILIGQASRN